MKAVAPCRRPDRRACSGCVARRRRTTVRPCLDLAPGSARGAPRRRTSPAPGAAAPCSPPRSPAPQRGSPQPAPRRRRGSTAATCSASSSGTPAQPRPTAGSRSRRRRGRMQAPARPVRRSATAPPTKPPGPDRPAKGAASPSRGARDESSARRSAGRRCRGAQVLETRDAEGSPRYACVIAPSGVETRAPLPLIVFFHADGDNPTSVDKETGLRKLGATWNLTGDPAHAGFIVLAPQGRAFKTPARPSASVARRCTRRSRRSTSSSPARATSTSRPSTPSSTSCSRRSSSTGGASTRSAPPTAATWRRRTP